VVEQCRIYYCEANYSRLGPDLRAVEAKKVFMALQWKAAVEPKIEVEATV